MGSAHARNIHSPPMKKGVLTMNILQPAIEVNDSRRTIAVFVCYYFFWGNKYWFFVEVLSDGTIQQPLFL